MRSFLLLTLSFLMSWGVWAQGPAEVHYSWSYALDAEGPETVLRKSARLPADARLILRLQAGAAPVTAVIFNSSRGQMDGRDLPLVLDLAAKQTLASSWKLGRLPGSRVYLALLNHDSTEVNAVKIAYGQRTGRRPGG